MIPIINKAFFLNRSNENEILTEITKQRIFARLKNNGFNSENLLYVKKLNYRLYRNYNSALRRTYRLVPGGMAEIILALANEYTTIAFLHKNLNERNKQILKNECRAKYNINDEDTILFDILSYE